MIQIIKRPIVTEKNSQLAESGVYVFEVYDKASKPQIKNAVEKLFNVKVNGVRTVMCRNKATRTRLGISKVQYWKKALIKLAPGEKISLFEGA